jgi:hypothetical protein
MMVTFGEPVREKRCTTREGKFWKTRIARELCDSEEKKEGKLPQGAKSLHLGGRVFP